MALEQVIYDLEEVRELSDEELYQRLYDSWGFENHKIDVWCGLRWSAWLRHIISATDRAANSLRLTAMNNVSQFIQHSPRAPYRLFAAMGSK
nr:hypothetical protein [Ferrimonas senticii]